MTHRFGFHPGYRVGDGDDLRLMPATGCPQGTYWNDMYGKCLPAGIPMPPPLPVSITPAAPPIAPASVSAAGFWPYFPPPPFADEGCDDCDTIVSGDPCAGAEGASIGLAFLNPFAAIFGASATQKCRERQLHRERGRHEERHEERRHEEHRREVHRAGWDGGLQHPWQHPWHHGHHHRPWWEQGQEQFYVGETPTGDLVKAPAHPAVQEATSQATQAPVVHEATARAAQAPGATASHVTDVSQAATHAEGATTAAQTAARAAPVASHPEVASSAATAARNAAAQARSATTAAVHPAAPGTRAARAARTSAAHASRAASHAHAATESPTRHGAEAHERAAHAHTRAAAAHARFAHGEARRGFGGARFGGGPSREWYRRPEFADYERRYGARWWERPEFADFHWRYGGEWWRRPEFADYERRYGARWWERPEFASYASYYAQQDQQQDGGALPGGAPPGGEGQVVCILPGDDGSCLKEMVTRIDGAIFYRVTEAGQDAGTVLDQDEAAHNAAIGMSGAPPVMAVPTSGDSGDAGDGDGGDVGDGGPDDTATTGAFAGWGHGGADPFTDPYGRFNPHLPPAWNTEYAYYPDYYEDPRVGIQSGPAIVGVQSGPAIVGAMAPRPRGMQGGFYHAPPGYEEAAAREQIEAMYPNFGDPGDAGFEMDGAGAYPGYGFGGWGFWGHGL